MASDRKEPKESTLKVYEATLRTILNKLGRSERPKSPLESWASLSIMQPILDGVKPSTAKVYLSAMVYFSKRDGSSIGYVRSLQTKITELFKRIPPKEDLGVTKDDLQPEIDLYRKVYDEYLSKLKDNATNTNLIFVFYTYPFHNRNFRPLRNDLWTLVVGKQDTGNYYCPKENIIYLRDYKSSGRYGDIKILIPKELNDILVDFMTRKKINDGDKLVSVGSSSYISALLRRRELSTRRMRNVFHMYYNGDNIRQLKDDAKNMMHTVDVAINHYCV